MLTWLSKIIFFKIAGWRFEGRWPKEIAKMVTIEVPHTSYWDFPIGILIRRILDVEIQWAGKASLFRFPFGILGRWMGGVPVVRSKRTNFVSALVEIYNKSDKMNICIAAEGTRGKVDKLKTGFYYIATGANVPIFMVKFDYKNRIVWMREPFYPTGDFEADMSIIDNYFAGTQGKYPSKSYKFPA